jgi:hypothetical protein
VQEVRDRYLEGARRQYQLLKGKKNMKKELMSWRKRYLKSIEFLFRGRKKYHEFLDALGQIDIGIISSSGDIINSQELSRNFTYSQELMIVTTVVIQIAEILSHKAVKHRHLELMTCFRVGLLKVIDLIKGINLRYKDHFNHQGVLNYGEKMLVSHESLVCSLSIIITDETRKHDRLGGTLLEPLLGELQNN